MAIASASTPKVCGLGNGEGKYWSATTFFDLPLPESFFY